VMAEQAGRTSVVQDTLREPVLQMRRALAHSVSDMGTTVSNTAKTMTQEHVLA